MDRAKAAAGQNEFLRQQAERRLRQRKPSTPTLPELTEENVRRQLQELQVNQIELELQNNELTELQHARNEIEQGLLRYTELYDFAPIGYITLDREGRLCETNLTGAKMLGEVRAVLAGRRLADFIAPASLPTFFSFLERVFEGQAKESCELRQEVGDGQALQVHIDANVNVSGRTCHAVMIDVTERKLAADSMRLASLVYQNSSEAMAVFCASGIFLSVNPAFTEVTGYTAKEVIGKSLRLLHSDHHSASFYDSIVANIQHSGHWQGEIHGRRKDRAVHICQATVNAIFNEDNSVQRYVALFSDITKRKEAEQLIWQQANFDLLTGLPNRNMFQDHLEQEIRKSHRARLPLALMFLDLDHFKDVNDTLGHAVGDTLLKEAAARLRSCVRETDTVARLGGDEFTIVMGELDDVDSVERVAHAILHKLAEPFYLADKLLYVTVSIGVTLYPADAVEIDSLLKNADQAMYAAKNLGRNRHQYFTNSMQEAAQVRMRIIDDMREALADGQFQLFYQPIVDMHSGAILKAEALIRWHHPSRGLVLPAEFIPIAEDTGIITAIGEWVLAEAMREALHWRAHMNAQFQVSVNMSPAQFLGPDHAQQKYRRTGAMPPLDGQGMAGLVLEITEGLLLDANPYVNRQLHVLRAAGIQVSIDDFGTGYSSLSYLKKFPIDYIKIDQSFVSDLVAGSDDMALCEAIIVMAHKLGLKVISEGVETEEQRNLLAAAGSDFGQGFLYSPAIPALEFEKLLAPRARDSLA